MALIKLRLQIHENTQVSLTAFNITENDFCEEEENGTILPALDQDQEFSKLLTKRILRPHNFQAKDQILKGNFFKNSYDLAYHRCKAF